MTKKAITAKIILATLTILTTLFGCSKKDDDTEEDLGNWLTAATFDGTARSSASGFVVGNKGYLGTGYDGDNYLNDFWEFNIDGGFWVQKANFPGTKRSATTTFNVGNFGYMGLGYDGTNELKDFYKYNPANNTWTSIANFGGNIRRSAIGFSSATKGYVGCGYDGSNDKKDFWRYDPQTDVWTEIFGFGGNKRRDAISFKIDDKIYFGTGKSNGINLIDFWSFNTQTETWTKLRDIDDNDDDNGDTYTIVRSNAAAFTIGSLGYVCLGSPNGGTWEYDPKTDFWNRKTTFEGINRQDPVALSNGLRAFVTTGRSGNLYLDDMLEFKPFDEQVDND